MNNVEDIGAKYLIIYIIPHMLFINLTINFLEYFRICFYVRKMYITRFQQFIHLRRININ